MNQTPRLFNLHLVSDSTGETLNHVARACVAQFDGIESNDRVWSLIRNDRQLSMVCEAITQKPGVVFFTIINETLRAKLQDHCRRVGVPCVPVLEPALAALTQYLDLQAQKQPGRQHELDKDYFVRIEAMEFALACDDGQGLDKIYKADVILVGVSRTSKTPTCLYLANRGIFAANIPIVPNVDLPEILFELSAVKKGPLIMGLTRDPLSLVDIRKNRLKVMHETRESSYVDTDTVEEEVKWARKICLKQNWPILDVSRRSIEETSAEILIAYGKRRKRKEE